MRVIWRELIHSKNWNVLLIIFILVTAHEHNLPIETNNERIEAAAALNSLSRSEEYTIAFISYL